MNTLPTVYGARLTSAPALLLIPTTLATILAKAASLERLADLHQSEGNNWHADRLSHLAFELRCRALGMRA